MAAATHSQRQSAGFVLKPELTQGGPETIIEAGIDWLTCTCTEPAQRRDMQALAATLLHDEREQGNNIEPWNCLGFVGLHAGGIGFGDIDEMSLMRLSGPTAYRHWRSACQLATNVSRLDVQVTVRSAIEPQERVMQHHAQAIDHVAKLKRKPAVDLRLSNVRPPTLYLNQRQSTRFGRVYDKGGESKLDHYLGCVRYECQFNGKSGLYASRFVAAETSEHTAAEQMITGFFSERGLDLGWARVEPHSLVNPRRRSDASRRLAWLRNQVAPCVKDLIERNMLSETFEALGLSVYTGLNPTGPTGPKSKE